MVAAPMADLTEQAVVQDWPARLALTGVTLAVILLILALLRLGWRRRRDRQGLTLGQADAAPGGASSTGTAGGHRAAIDTPDTGGHRRGSAPTPQDEGSGTVEPEVARFAAKYAGTADRTDLSQRIAAGGGPARCDLHVGPTTLRVVRRGEPALPLSATDLLGVGTAGGMLHKAYRRGGLIMVHWSWQGRTVSSGFWIADPGPRAALLEALLELDANVRPDARSRTRPQDHSDSGGSRAESNPRADERTPR